MIIFDYLISFLMFPAMIIYPIRIEKQGVISHLSIESCQYLKGIAALLIVHSHFLTRIHTENQVSIGFFIIYEKWGTLATAIFFFLSGYGNYFSYKKGKSNRKFLYGFLLIYLPALLFSIIRTLLITKCSTISLSEVIGALTCYSNFWFVFELLIFETVLFIGYKAKVKINVLLLITSLVITVIFYSIGEEEYWYASNITFFAGYILGEKEDKINSYVENHLFKALIITFTILMLPATAIYCFNVEGWLCLICKNISSLMFVNFVYLIFKKIYVIKTPLCNIGKSSLYIYIIHLTLLGAEISRKISLSLFLICSVVISIMVSYSINRIKNIMKKENYSNE